MVLVDTSVWIDHLHTNETALNDLLRNDQVLAHPFIVGELACGNLRNRQAILRYLSKLPTSLIATHQEALVIIERHKLMARGIGYIDVHLLAATALTDTAKLWTKDKRLAKVALDLDLGYEL